MDFPDRNTIPYRIHFRRTDKTPVVMSMVMA
jgi:hypothetical protein